MNVLELFAPVRTFVFDVDGVLTNGTLMLTEDGHMLRSMNIKDGYAMQQAIKKGYNIWVITGGKSEAVRRKLNDLGVKEVRTSVQNKKEVLLEMAAAANIAHSSMLYMGDDIPDYTVMQLCALPCCPADAVPEI